MNRLTGEDEAELVPILALCGHHEQPKVPVIYKKGIENPALKDNFNLPRTLLSKETKRNGYPPYLHCWRNHRFNGCNGLQVHSENRRILERQGVIERVDVLLSTSARDLADLQYISPPTTEGGRKGKDIILSWTLLNIKPDSDIVIQKLLLAFLLKIVRPVS